MRRWGYLAEFQKLFGGIAHQRPHPALPDGDMDERWTVLSEQKFNKRRWCKHERSGRLHAKSNNAACFGMLTMDEPIDGTRRFRRGIEFIEEACGGYLRIAWERAEILDRIGSEISECRRAACQ